MEKGVMVALGEMVHTLRRRKGWSQHQLAAAIDASPTTVSNIEKGKVSTIHLGHLLGLAVALNTSPNALLGWVEEKRSDE